MNLESFDNLIISMVDTQANMGLFKKELAQKLDVSINCIQDPFFNTEVVNGVVKQYMYIGLSDKVEMGKLLNLGFDYFHDGFIVIEVGDTVL